MTRDINTTQAPATLVITDDIALTSLVHEAASLQLILNGAEVKQQATIEAAKKAFADATSETAQRITEIFAAIKAYCAKNRDRLFPKKGAKQAKTYAVLQHKLQYRISTSVESPKDIVKRIQERLGLIKTTIANLAPGQDVSALVELATKLESLLRTPPQEFNKEASLTAMQSAPADLGIKVTTSETFKLAFTFTPEQKS
jgi:phage host-nuclease inhibitor protein Gam